MSSNDTILTMENITKTFGPVKALTDVNLSVDRGEIHAICGENGAGKSTLMNVLSGVYPYGSYSGKITFDGKECKYHTINDSEADGIVIIHQELALSPFLSHCGEHLHRQRAGQGWRNRLGQDPCRGEEAARSCGTSRRPGYQGYGHRRRPSSSSSKSPRHCPRT